MSPRRAGNSGGIRIDENRRRDNRQRHLLRRQGYHVIRVWEHQLRADTWLKRLQAMLRRVERDERQRAG